MSLPDPRVCLFFEYRRWNHFTVRPEGEDLKCLRSLVEAIPVRLDGTRNDHISFADVADVKRGQVRIAFFRGSGRGVLKGAWAF